MNKPPNMKRYFIQQPRAMNELEGISCEYFKAIDAGDSEAIERLGPQHESAMRHWLGRWGASIANFNKNLDAWEAGSESAGAAYEPKDWERAL